MINFNKIEYKRPNYDNIKNIVLECVNKLEKCDDFEEYLQIVKEIIDIQNHIEEMFDYADINNMRNQSDEFYKEEIDYWNHHKQEFDNLFKDFYIEILNSKYRDKLIGILPDNFYRIINIEKVLISNDINELIAKEKELKKQYRELNRNTINYNGEEKTIGNISSLFSSSDRNIRKEAHDLINDYYYSKYDDYSKILFQLIQIRNEIAKKRGFNNYLEYSLLKLKRFDYDYTDIRKFRENIFKYITPICSELSKIQKEKLSVEELMYYDTIFFTDSPESKYLGENLLNIYQDVLSKIDDELFNVYKDMLKNNYIDLLQNSDKVNFSITNYLTESCSPAITGNFKNNYLDVKTLSHELGHSFQKYCSSIKDKEYIVSSLLKYPTMEIAEMFSYAMELIITDKAQILFDEDNYNKYKFMEMYNLIVNLPYICLVDEFQEIIYTKQDLKCEDLGKIWKELSTKYSLNRSNSGHINLDGGGYYFRQSHIYLDPFYYIDYALSYFGAFAIWSKSKDNLELFKNIGSVASYYSFKDLIKKYNLPNPFEDNTVKEVSKILKKEIFESL